MTDDRGLQHAAVDGVDVRVIVAKGRDFELETVFHHEDHAKMRANRVGAREKLLHDVRLGIRGNVEIFWDLLTDNVAHTAPRKVRDMTAFAQARGNFTRRLFHRRGFHWMRTVHRTCPSILRAQTIEVNRPYPVGELLPCQRE